MEDRYLYHSYHQALNEVLVGLNHLFDLLFLIWWIQWTNYKRKKKWFRTFACFLLFNSKNLRTNSCAKTEIQIFHNGNRKITSFKPVRKSCIFFFLFDISKNWRKKWLIDTFKCLKYNFEFNMFLKLKDL